MEKKYEGGKTAGIILAAGIGKRMQPLTSILPKPLLPILGTPLFEITAVKLMRSGVSSIHSNLYHLADHIEEFAAARDWPLTFHRENSLLGTGGGIGNMASDLAAFENILLHNGDIVSNVDLPSVLSFHRARGALVTMILSSSVLPASVTYTSRGEIVSIGDRANRTDPDQRDLGYTGMAVISHRALDYFPNNERIGLVEILLRIIGERPGTVMGFDASSAGTGCSWGEIGTPAGYLDIHRRILKEKVRFDPLLEPSVLPLHVGRNARISRGVTWHGFLEVGPGAVIESNASLEDCVVLEGTTVPANSVYTESILFPGGVIEVGKD
jgi:NDP-sugar pyrophosphorylase family protein